MRIVVAIIIYFLFVQNSFAGLFGPSTFEECLLDNMKNAKTNEAVAAVSAACSMKFKKSANLEKNKEVKICQIYWDGWKFVQGDSPNADYMVLEHSFLGATALHLSLPRSMGKYLQIEKDLKTRDLDYTSKYGKFFNENYSQIRSLCAFN